MGQDGPVSLASLSENTKCQVTCSPAKPKYGRRGICGRIWRYDVTRIRKDT
jgi:hypothetical protein